MLWSTLPSWEPGVSALGDSNACCRVSQPRDEGQEADVLSTRSLHAPSMTEGCLQGNELASAPAARSRAPRQGQGVLGKQPRV